jgi:single-stranded-DNA-specific exonuclease
MTFWQKRQDKKLSQELQAEFKLGPNTAQLFALRGLDTEDKINWWLNATENDLADPALMHDVEKAAARIEQAIDRGEKITIYGDYDADGISASAILIDVLEILGAEPELYIPDRFTEGYGPNLAAYKKIIAGGTKLIITVDNGVTAIEECRYARQHGVDVIVTDHHTFQEQKPDCYALVHCNYPGQKYPFDDYCGAGVAYTLARQLMQDPMPELLDLAVLGTVGDMVKVTGEGHIILRRGLEVLNSTTRPGLRALIEKSGLKLGQVDEKDLGFSVVPRLNATGRLADAKLAVRLLLTDSEEEAANLADQVDKLNQKRQTLTKDIYEQALAQVKKHGWQNNSTLTLYGPDWHEGVLGLVANKVARKLNKPTLILTKGTDGVAKGSGRSLPGFNLFDALNPLKEELLTRFGGHDYACGLSLPVDKIPALRTAFENSFHGFLPEKKDYDFELDPQLTLADWRAMHQAGPFGTGNPEPVFSLTDPAIMKSQTMGQDGSHLRLQVGHLNVAGFDDGFLLQHKQLDLVKRFFVTLSVNYWRGQTSLQAIIVGWQYGLPAVLQGQPVVDVRHCVGDLQLADTYLFYTQKGLGQGQRAWGLTDEQVALVDDYTGGKAASIVELPPDRVRLDQALAKHYDQLYLRFFFDQLPVTSLPTRQNYIDVWHYVLTHPGLKPNDYYLVAPYLGMSSDEIFFVLRVFFDLKFVRINLSKISADGQHPKQKLTDSKYFRAVAQQLAFARQLRTMPRQQLLTYAQRHLK